MPLPQVFLLLKGQPGSGKSTLGRGISRQLRWPLIDKDDARDAFEQVLMAEAGEKTRHAIYIDWNSLSYDVIFRVVETQLACGLSVILDTPLARLSLFERAAALARRHDAVIAVVDCYAGNEAIWTQRLEFRGRTDAGTERQHKPTNTLAVQAIMQRNNGSENWLDSVQVHCIRVDTTSASRDEQVDAVVKALDSMQPDTENPQRS
jgi:predicted kinase